MRVLTPTENKRLNELIGFLCITIAILMALALLTYQPQDVALNVSAPPSDGPLARNWIGPVGAYGADLLFQVFGFAAFLLPVAIGILGWRWLRSRSIDSQVGDAWWVMCCCCCRCLRCCRCGTFRRFAARYLLVGLLGSVISNELRTGFNLWGANLVVIAILITALFMTTRFSFSGAHAWAAARRDPSAPSKSWEFCRKCKRAGTLGGIRAKTSACGAVCRRRAPPAASL